jgi:lipopolysaccharide transport system permease protein
MHQHPVRPGALLASLLRHRELILRLAAREFGQRFRGSLLGVGWAVLTPLLTAAVFTFVFSAVFPSRWGGPSAPQGPFDFAILFLAGLAVHSIFAECVTRGPALVVGNASYVTKVVFPLEVLPFVAALTALTNATISLGIVLLANLLLNGELHATALFLPLVLAPYLLFVVALCMLLAATGVYLRDLGQVVGLLVTVSLFLTPIFYPVEAVPAALRPVIWLNPLTFVVEQVRAVLVFGRFPDLPGLALYSLAAFGALAVAFWVFQRLRAGFADVL